MKILGIILIFMCLGCFGFLIVIGGSKFKSKREQDQEDEEQMNYLKNVEIKRRCENISSFNLGGNMEDYNYKDISRTEKIACIVLATYTLLSSGNLEITVQDIENEVDVICRVYKRSDLIIIANQKLSDQRKRKF